MARSFEYRVCNVQQGHVTFVNGVWQGSAPLAEVAGLTDPFKFCVEVWDYLRLAGEDGWELVAAATHEQKDAVYDVLYLKREN
ncbi:MAG: hypothetical protein QOF61_2453 [Acidobacteriota bacterium]|jgi:hypothetical protein|nr:hypothetical protein [Acidobacteriota bacterium]